MQEKKEPAKITWRGAFWLIVAFSAIFAFTGWVYGENSGYDRGYEEGKQEIQSHLQPVRQESYEYGYKQGYADADTDLTFIDMETGEEIKINRYPTEEGGRQSENDYNTQERPDNSQQASDEQSQTVYITNTGEKYHRDGCQYLRQSKIAISLDDAINQGYTACSRCW